MPKTMTRKEFLEKYKNGDELTFVEPLTQQVKEAVLIGADPSNASCVVIAPVAGGLRTVNLGHIREAQLPDEPEEREVEVWTDLSMGLRLYMRTDKDENYGKFPPNWTESQGAHRTLIHVPADGSQPYTNREKELEERCKSYKQHSTEQHKREVVLNKKIAELDRENRKLKSDNHRLRQQGERLVVPGDVISKLENFSDTAAKLSLRFPMAEKLSRDIAALSKQLRQLPQAKRVEVGEGIYKLRPRTRPGGVHEHYFEPIDPTGREVWLVPNADGEEGER